MSSINLTQAKPFTLLEPIGTTETEISVKNLVDIYGEQVVMSGDIQYATLEPKSLENQEIISYTDIVIISSTVSKLTGVTRGCDAQPDPVTGLYGNSPTQIKPHAGDVTCILSDNPQVWDKKTSKDEDETVTGNWTFTEQVIVPNPNLGQEAVNLDTLNSVVVSGAGDASTIAKGITRLSESPNLTIGTATITIATPAVVTYVSHGLTVNDTIQFTTTGTLPTGILPSTTYYVISTGLTADAFQISATYSGTAIDTTGSQSGTHTLIKTTPVAVGVYDTRLPTQDENDALGGTAGTPSTSNKYVTNDDTSAAAGADKVVRATGTALPALDGSNLTGIAKTTNVQTFTADDTWTKPTGAKSVLVQMWGAGGGGTGGTANAGGAGGAGGSYAEKTFNASDLSATEAIVVGVGAAATIGGNSSFGSTKLIAYGGGAGSGSSGGGGGGAGVGSAGNSGSGSTGGNGGTFIGGTGGGGGVAGGTSNFGGGGGGGGGNTGAAGGLSVEGGGGGGGGSTNSGAPAVGGAGGSSYRGGGGGGGGGSGTNSGGAGGTSIHGGSGGAGAQPTNNGTAGSIPGGGGGAGAGTSSTGGAGARGQVVVTTYF